MDVLIIGAGGHGLVVADILLKQLNYNGDVRPIGFLDDNQTLQQQTLLGLPVLGTPAQLGQFKHDGVIIAIGDNDTRRRMYERLWDHEELLIKAIHPSAIIGTGVEVGPGTMISAGAIVNPGAYVGQGVILNTGCTVDHHNQIDDYVHIAPGVHLGGDVEISIGTLIGIGATVMPQCRIGAWSVVGAGAVVTNDLPARSRVVGIPARPY